MNNDDIILKQVYMFSIIGLICSLILGFGLIFTIPCFIYALNIKINYNNNDSTSDILLVYCVSSFALSIISLFVFLYLIPTMI